LLSVILKHMSKLSQPKFIVILFAGVTLLIIGFNYFSPLTINQVLAPTTPTKLASSTQNTSDTTADIVPSREAYGDCKWERVAGAGISFYGQRCEFEDRVLKVAISETLPGAFLEEETASGSVAIDELIQIFPIPDGDVSAVISTLADDTGWNPAEGCAFSVLEEMSTDDITRYDLRPTGKALVEYSKIASQEPVTSTCNEYGMGNSGVRYFEVHASNPNKALFLEMGQEAPLFDEKSIKVL
jgi:hypothetical protein